MVVCTYVQLLGVNKLLPLKLFSKEKNRKKRKPFEQGGQAQKPKGNGISPEGWQGNTTTRRSHLYLPCHYAVSFWLGGVVAVRLIFATFLFFFNIFLNLQSGNYTSNATSGFNIRSLICLSAYFSRNKHSLAMQDGKEIEKIPIEEAMELLRKSGIDVGKEEAELVMEFLYNLTVIVIRECFDVE